MQSAPRASPDGRRPIRPRRRAPTALLASVIAHGALLTAALLLVRTAIPAAPTGPVAMQMEFAAVPAQAAPAPERAPPAAEESPAPQPPQRERSAPPSPTPVLQPTPATKPEPAPVAASVPVPEPVPLPVPGPILVPAPATVTPVEPLIRKLVHRAAPVPSKNTAAPPTHSLPARAAAPDATLSAPATPTPTSAAPVAAEAHAAPIDGGWMRAIGAWLAAHKTYPEEALQHAEEGRLAVRFTMDRSGLVTAVEVIRGSGSEALDRAALTMLKDAMLPPLPEAMQQPTITVTVQIRFALAR